MGVLISCEVGGTEVPAPLIVSGDGEWRDVDPANRGISKSANLTCDGAARYAAERMSRGLGASLVTNDYSSDLIDVTRSLHHRELFPKLTRSLPASDRQWLIDTVYVPYREQVRRSVASLLLRHSAVIHLSVRTFEPTSNGRVCRADVGLLYDPSHDDEVDLCLDWMDQMYDQAPMLRVRRNYPRRGTTDSLTRSMRSQFAAQRYIGIEVLLNRAWAKRSVLMRDQAIDGMSRSLKTITDAIRAEAA